jgi:ABC-type bacteriocin/lantibiotic exporter with double-glycine peptidase domain
MNRQLMKRGLTALCLLGMVYGLWRLTIVLQAYNGLSLTNRVDLRYRQQTDVTCGPAGLRYILQHKFNQDVSEEELSQFAKTTSTGTTLHGLKTAANQLGYNATAWRWQERHLASLELPALVNLHRWRHYGVLTEVEHDHVIVFDPAQGKYLRFTRQAFRYFWDGTVLVVS